jgi:hypothetical protein
MFMECLPDGSPQSWALGSGCETEFAHLLPIALFGLHRRRYLRNRAITPFEHTPESKRALSQ